MRKYWLRVELKNRTLSDEGELAELCTVKRFMERVREFEAPATQITVLERIMATRVSGEPPHRHVEDVEVDVEVGE